MMTHDQKFADWAELEIRRIIDDLILDDDQGRVLAFGTYSIEPTRFGANVLEHGEKIVDFRNRKTALSWCVARRHQLISFANQIRALDQQQRRLEQDLSFSLDMSRKTKDCHFADLINNKIQSKQHRFLTIADELEKCLQRAKYIQLRGKKNETARSCF